MGKKKKPSPATAPEPPRAPFHAAFAGLEALREELPEGEAAPAEAGSSEANDDAARAPSTARLAGNLVVRHQRKGRGGKTVTLLTGLRSPPEERKALGRELAAALGCAARLEGEDVVLSGDLRTRLSEWLRQRGARVRVG